MLGNILLKALAVFLSHDPAHALSRPGSHSDHDLECMLPALGDFGMAFIRGGTTTTRTATDESGLLGTLGFMDPVSFLQT